MQEDNPETERQLNPQPNKLTVEVRPEINEEEPEIFEKTGKTPVPKSD